ncbi:reverse transcriptase domain-containing protein [Tanacetum coccineum]
MIVIWNPSIRKSVGIVVPWVLTNSFNKMTDFGFRLCPSTNDPIVVGISKCFWKDKHKVGIFTLSSKTWKMIPTSNVPRESVTFQFSTQVAIDRFIFWVAYDWIVGEDGISHYKSLILSFDLITHEFKEVNLPVSIPNRDISISKLNESLVVSAYTAEVHGVWIMGEEGGVMTSFTKLFNIKTPYDPPVRKVLGFTMSGELIIEIENHYGESATVEVYKPSSEHVNELGINGEDG